MESVDQYSDATVYKGNFGELICTCEREDCWHIRKTHARLSILKAKQEVFKKHNKEEQAWHQFIPGHLKVTPRVWEAWMELFQQRHARHF